FYPHGCFLIKHYNQAGQLIGVYKVPNGIVDVGMEDLLDVYFQASSQSTLWYISLVDNAGFSAFADGDTMGSHAGWSEGEDYTEGTRPQWTVGAASSRQITNAATVDFSINATDTLKGIFITDSATKGGATGVLWATAAFSSTVAVTSGDTLKITYTVSG
ncbi:hypothetical protein LCGC14_2922080, partial [marine sediment metagenome]